MSDLFSIALSGLNIARTALLTTAHNTANVSTPGYSRQSIVAATNAAEPTNGGYVGTGARVAGIVRNYDGFLNAQLSQADSSAASLDTYSAQVSRLDNLLADRTSGLSTVMQTFFAGVQGVADTPADPAARQQLLSSAQTLAGKFRSVDSYLEDLSGSVNSQIAGSIDQVNGIASQIASLNKQIAQLSSAAGGEPPNDLLDTRDQLVSNLSKIVGVTVVQQDGMYNLFVGSGHTLVLGDRAGSLSAVPSAADLSCTAVAIQGVNGNTSEMKDSDLTGGSLGGLVAFRAQSLMMTQNAIGRLAITLASGFNSQHMQGVDLQGSAGQQLFTFSGSSALNNQHNAGNLDLASAIADPSKLTTSDYSVEVHGTSFVVTRLSDGQQVPTTIVPPNADASSFTCLSFDGVTIAPTAAGQIPADGDRFLVQPTRGGARDLAVAITDPAKIAAAGWSMQAACASTNAGTATIAQSTTAASSASTPAVTLTYDSSSNTFNASPAQAVTVTTSGGTTSTYAAGLPVPYTSGAGLTMDGATFSINGMPADGDTFTLTSQPGGPSDGSNALLMAGLQRRNLVDNGSSTLNGAYAGLVSDVGNEAQQVQVASSSQASLASQVRADQQSVSGVNQDEEAANLMQYQQMYQANAKVIQAASTMFNTILGLQANG